MSGKSQPYYKQVVKATELAEIINDANTQSKRSDVANNMVGIKSGLVVTEHSPAADSTIDISLGIAISKSGEYVNVALAQNMDLASYVPTVDNKYVSIFLGPSWIYEDPRTDGHGNVVYYRKTESFELSIVESAESASPVLPSLDTENILLADILLTPSHSVNPIQNSDIDNDRREIPLAMVMDDANKNITINELKIKTYTGGTTPPALHDDNYIALWINASGQVFLIYQKTGGSVVSVELS